MKRYKTFFLLVVTVLIMAIAAGCGGGESGTDTSDSGAEKSEPAKEVVIGFTGPLSGPGAQYGKDVLSGIEMAVNEINKAGGITVNGQKYKFKLEKLDDMIDPTQAVNNARRFVERYNAPAVFNPVFNTIGPLMEINQQQGSEFLMMAYTSTPAVDELDNDLTISIPPPFTAYVEGLSDIAWDQGWRKAAMVVTLGAYGDEWREAFEEHWENLGGEITADQPANYYAETDFSSQLTAALDTNPDVLLIGGPSETTGLVIEQARNLGFKGGFILVDQAKMDYIADEMFGGSLELMNNTVGVAAVAGIPIEYAPVFDKKYTEKFNAHNTWEAVLNYCAMNALAQAMVEAGTVEDVRAIREAFSKVSTLTGDKYPAEFFGLHESGRMLPPANGQIIKNGAYQEPTTFVWWADSEEEFNRVVGKMSADNPAKMMPLDFYTK